MESSEHTTGNRQNLSNQILVGILLIVIGLAFLVGNLGWADFTWLVRWIPSFFILLGVWQLIVNKFRIVVGPLILIVGGAAFQLATFGVIEFRAIWQFWPLILILIGGSMLLERAGMQVPNPLRHPEHEDEVSILAIFSGSEHMVTSTAFKGGEATAIFGGIDLDLRQAEVASFPARINAFALFGGVDMIVPAGWSVQTDVIGIFGGVDDERTDKASVQNNLPDVLVTGFALFGGITLKS